MHTKELEPLGLVNPMTLSSTTLSFQLTLNEFENTAHKVEAVHNRIQHYTLVFHTELLKIKIPV